MICNERNQSPVTFVEEAKLVRNFTTVCVNTFYFLKVLYVEKVCSEALLVNNAF